jgi:hypothetical protein
MGDRQIDRDKLRAAIRRMGSENVFYMLDDAVTLLPQAKLRKLIKDYLNPAELCSDGTVKGNLLADVKTFQAASLSGSYYNGFAINSKNCTEKSSGTLAWIADCRRLLNCCVEETTNKRDVAEVRQAFEITFSLLDHIDECEDDVIFFADEGGSWEVEVDWEKVLPAWFRVLSATVSPAEYAQRIDAVLNHHYRHGRAKMLAVARRIATPAQRQTLPKS